MVQNEAKISLTFHQVEANSREVAGGCIHFVDLIRAQNRSVTGGTVLRGHAFVRIKYKWPNSARFSALNDVRLGLSAPEWIVQNEAVIRWVDRRTPEAFPMLPPVRTIQVTQCNAKCPGPICNIWESRTLELLHWKASMQNPLKYSLCKSARLTSLDGRHNPTFKLCPVEWETHSLKNRAINETTQGRGRLWINTKLAHDGEQEHPDGFEPQFLNISLPDSAISVSVVIRFVLQ